MTASIAAFVIMVVIPLGMALVGHHNEQGYLYMYVLSVMGVLFGTAMIAFLSTSVSTPHCTIISY